MSQSINRLAISHLIVLGLITAGFAGFLYTEGSVAPLWIAAGIAVSVMADLWITHEIRPFTLTRNMRAVIGFVVGGSVLWILFELQPSLVTYASASFGLAGGFLFSRTLWLVNK
ncbi:hypothetical protein K0C01_04520 [Salinarchaeum sp. IM2453]|uniref:hypothetical protein n=1 Tax=Salinarchaeum sp. IM2453 TaxID=2862870 RepID=UPI001C82AB45|nr:hypothetical protein [Salinarchaeum sp. IM2453]QZA89408.1 hypothetical protein K0C01_04520 [Salinarchaeum sp. IM2453]